jgi:hypothetical protein
MIVHIVVWIVLGPGILKGSLSGVSKSTTRKREPGQAPKLRG